MSETLSIVMPLKTTGHHYAHNVGRADILFSSLRKFASAEMFDRVVIVAPRDEVAAIASCARHWRPFRVDVVDERDHIPSFHCYTKAHQVRSWHRQQIVKLAAATLVDTEFFLVVDPDVFATKPFRTDDIIRGGKAALDPGSRSIHTRWWQASASLLGLAADPTGVGMRVTPAILSRSICLALHDELRRLHGLDWHEVLLRNCQVDWTEYSLYYLFAESTGLLSKHHYASGGSDRFKLHNEVSVWRRRDLTAFDPLRCFARDTPGIFSVIQSNTGLSPREIVRLIKRHLEVDLQVYRPHLALRARVTEMYGAARRKIARQLSTFDN